MKICFVLFELCFVLLQNAELCVSSDSSQDNIGSDSSQGLIVFCLAGETNLDVISAAAYLEMSFFPAPRLCSLSLF